METLEAVPGHVLDGDERALGEEEEIEVSVGDDCVVCALDYGGKGAEGGGDGLVAFGEEVLAAGADVVVGRWGVDDFLDIWLRG